jgi:hypothetical protein
MPLGNHKEWVFDKNGQISGTIFSERSEIQKNTYSMIFIWGLKTELSEIWGVTASGDQCH